MKRNKTISCLVSQGVRRCRICLDGVNAEDGPFRARNEPEEKRRIAIVGELFRRGKLWTTLGGKKGIELNDATRKRGTQGRSRRGLK